MNAAGRAPRGGHGVDFFPTPARAVHALLGALELPGGVWFEPSVGSAAIVRATEQVRPGRQTWTACELRREALPVAHVAPDLVRVGDFLDPATCADLPAPDVIIGNPPYSHALAFAARCVELAGGRAWVAMLLRLGFLESEERAPWLRRYPPDVYPLAHRPSFNGGLSTDSAAYAWFVWPPGGPRRLGCAPIDAPTGQRDLFGGAS